jgi:HAD superfamily hydrolase (TIGR01450 family)
MKYVIDIDGTLMDTDRCMDAAPAFLDRLNEGGIDYVLMTNSIKSVDVQVERLAKAGLRVGRDRILNPIVAINRHLDAEGLRKVKAIGTDAEILQVSAENVREGHEAVILLDFEKGNLGYAVLEDILSDLEAGIETLTASVSPWYYKNGRKFIDTGAFVRLLEEVSGKRITNYGKPSRAYFGIAGMILGATPAEVTVIGDDWSTDVAGAREWGARSVLVRTGKYRAGDEELGKPDKVVDSLEGLSP